jgi:hypothetical protein
MLQMGNLAPRTRPLPGAHGGSAQGPSPLQAVLGALGGCTAGDGGVPSPHQTGSSAGRAVPGPAEAMIIGRSPVRPRAAVNSPPITAPTPIAAVMKP